MALERRHFLQAVGSTVVTCVGSMLLPAGEASGQATYPDKPIRLIVGFAAGGPANFVARVIGDALSKALGQPVVVENVAGAGGNLATARVVKAAPDGYTLLMATSGMIVNNPLLYQKLPFDPI